LILSVVIVGIAINIVSHYILKTLDPRLSRISSWWRERSEVQKAQRLKELEKLRDNPHEQILLAFSEVRDGITTVMLFILALVSLLFSVSASELLRHITGLGEFEMPLQSMGYVLGALAFFLGFLLFRRAMDRRQLLRESRVPSDDTKTSRRVNVAQEALIVLYGIYGAKGQYRDVTQRLNELMEGERLKINVDNPTLVGDDDPIKGERKNLVALYSYDGLIFPITKREREELLLPPEITL
jgi:hypothetical protein